MPRLQLVADDVLAQLHVVDHPFRPAPPNPNELLLNVDDRADIRVVGIGTLGKKVVSFLSRNLPGVRLHEIQRTVDRNLSSGMLSLLSSTRACDFVFIVTGFDDQHCEATTQVVGAAAAGAGVLAVVVTPGNMEHMPFLSNDIPKWYDSLIRVSSSSFPDHSDTVLLNPDSLTGYAMRHAVTTISTLITVQSGICVDLADIKAVMKGGSIGRMGIGIGSDDSRGATAAVRAIERLKAQGVDMSSATGVLVSVHGSGDLGMSDFDAACKVIHDHASNDANLLVGLISDEQLGGNVKVTILAVHPT